MICLFRSVPLVLGLWIAKWIETTIPFNVNQVLSALLFILYLPILSDQDWKSSNGLMCFDFPFVDMRNYSHCLHLAIQTMKHRDLVLAVATCSLCYTSLVEIFWWQTSCRSRARPGHTKYSPAQLADTSSARFTVRCQPSKLYRSPLTCWRCHDETAIVAPVARQNKQCAYVRWERLGPW